LDISTVIGLIGGTALVLVSMLLAANLGTFWDLTSIIIVLGGSSFATMIRWPLDKFIAGVKSTLKAISTKATAPKEIIDQILELAQTARKESILALEKVTISDEFLAKAVRLLVDGYPPEVIQDMIDLEIDTLTQRHKDGRGIVENMGESSPAFGMIGTVMGLVVIMANLSDPSAIGPGIAVALITTLYGALLANLVFIPLGSKLKYRSEEEAINMEIVREGVNSISKGENPKVIQQKLEAYLEPKERAEDT
jgi:chemotaxis protein MotA